MSTIATCWLCQRPITGKSASREHIIPNAIGGRRRIGGFLCVKCNSDTGSAWDNRLAGRLNYFSVLFDIRRHRGTIPSVKARTAGGQQVEILPGNRPVIGKPTHKVTQDETGVRIQVSARSRREARKMLEGLRRHHPQIDVAQALEGLQDNGLFSNDPYQIVVDVQGPSTDRSIVKSAVALACEAGLAPADCDLAIAYLREEDAEYEKDGFWHYYQQDLVENRNIGLPLHCAYVTGNPSSGLLLGYVEYYGFVRRVICLSRQYRRESISRIYAVDPVTGQEVKDVQVDLDDSRFAIVKTQTAEGLQAGLQRALEPIMASGMLLSRCRTIARVSVECAREYCERKGLILQSADRHDLIEEVVQRLKPLIAHYTRPMEFPEGVDPTKGATE